MWVSVSCAQAQVKNCADALTRFDPARGERYQARARVYIGKLEGLRERMQGELSPYRGKKIVTCHDSFPYFAREFGFQIAGVVEREPGSAPNAQELARTIRLVRSSGIGILFAEPQYPAAAADVIARETGAKVYVLDPAVTGPDDPDAYLRIMEKNLMILKEAFRG